MKIIDNEEIKHSSRKKKLPFSKYENAVNCTNIVEWIKDNIAKSENGRIKVRIIDLVKELDIKFQNITYTAIYTALDYVFFKRDILVNLSTANNGDKLLVFRLKKDTDKAPHWIENLLNKEIDIEKSEEYKSIIKRKIRLLQLIEDDKEIGEIGESKEENKESKEENKIRERTGAAIRKQKVLKESEMKEGDLNDLYENPYKVDIFVFDFLKLGWKVKQSKTVYTDLQMLELIKQNISKPEDRHRIEITAINKKETQKEIKDEKKIEGEIEKEEGKEEKEVGVEREVEKEEGKDEKDVGVEREVERDENKQPQEVEDKLSQLLPDKRDNEQKAAIQYLIQKYKKSYPNEKNK